MKTLKIQAFLYPMLVFCGLGCFSKNNFEGRITYVNNFIPLHKNMSVEYLKEKYGDTVVIKFKNGFYKHEYNTNTEDAIKELTYHPTTNKAYMKIGKSDTLIWFSCLNTPRKLYNKNTKESEGLILNKACRTIEFESAFEQENLVYNITTRFFYSPDYLCIDPSLMEMHGEGYLSEYFKIAKSMYLRYDYVEHEAFEKQQIAIEALNLKIDMSEFYVDTLKTKPFY
tara:strand:+ start:200 stop:877 length:678 start_codon:yes stop_codon:yes gene_type:complete